MGISYEHCLKHNPNIIYLSSSGFGPTGPYSQNRIYDPVIQSWAGAGHIQRNRYNGKPVLYANAIADKITALTSCQAMLAALTARENGAGGQHIDISMLECAMQFLWPDGFRNFTWSDQKGENEKPIIDELPNVPDEIKKFETKLIKPHDSNLDKYLEKPNPRHSFFNEFRASKYPATFSNHPLESRPASPMIGEHTVKLLRELGYSGSQIQTWLDKGVVTSATSLMLKMKKSKEAKAFTFVDETHRAFSENTFGGARVSGHSKPRDANAWVGKGPLSGFKLVEFSHNLTGPMGCMILSDQGVKVTKVEVEGNLDPIRGVGPNSTSHDSKIPCSSVYATLNRNKDSKIVKEKRLNGTLGELINDAHILVVDADLEKQYDYSYKEALLDNPNIIYVRVNKGMGEYKTQIMTGNGV
eukprot:UN31024